MNTSLSARRSGGDTPPAGAVTAFPSGLCAEEAKRIARSGSVAERVALAASAHVSPELLYFLAADQDASVRAAVAGNAATPMQADSLLGEDDAETVRVALARKVSALAPGLSAKNRNRLTRLTANTLARLVEDAAEAVRAAIAESVQSMPDAPRDIVLRLARDVAPAVATPVLANSPLLTDDDLLTLIADGLSPAALAAVARRDNLAEAVGDAIVATDEVEAITALLGNPSAHIRETTLDLLVARAATITEWQEPLVRRPALSPRIVSALAQVVSDHLAAALAARTDLDPGTLHRVRAAVQERLALQRAGVAAQDPAGRVNRLKQVGELDEKAVLAAAAEGDATYLAVLLAAKAMVDPGLVQRAVDLRSSKGIVALCWKAGLAMATAVRVQSVLARMPPDEVIQPRRDGGFPLAAAEMRSQLLLLARPPAPATARSWKPG